ncbi:hypothetical protein ACS0TY_000211 [Phlomoides rotata]
MSRVYLATSAYIYLLLVNSKFIVNRSVNIDQRNFTERNRAHLRWHLTHTIPNPHPKSDQESRSPSNFYSPTTASLSHPKLSFFQDFLERHSSSDEDDDDLGSRIAAAAYAAEDVIETHIVDQIDQARSTSNRGVHISSVDWYGGLERVIQDMDLIRNEVMEIKNIGAQHHDQLHTHSSVSIASVRPASKWQSNTAMAFDAVLIYDVLDKLTGQQHNLQVVSIVGMGGIGKTTFAHNIYSNLLIVQRFDILAWVTISQEYSRGSILQLLFQEINGSNHDLSEMSEDEIGERVRKELWDRRYLIVMDDIWSIGAWDCVKSFFPDNNNGSRIMITTRLSNLAFELSTSQAIQMNFLDGDKSWNLLCKIVFGEELDCPVELEDIGKEIARSCRGLPLSIVVVGGLLTKSNRTRAHWEYILQNLNSLINLEDGEYCLQILRTSYKNLPIHLKPCFLYMGVLREYKKIRVTKLIELWVAEGVLRPNKDKRLEEVAEASDEDDDDLGSRIAAAAYAAEDVIETHIVDQIDQARSTSNRGVHISSVDWYGGLERVIQDMDLIRNEVMEIKNIGAQHHDQLHTHSSVSIASVRPASKWQSNTAMAFDAVLIYDVLDKLTGQQHNLQIVSIVGMGGIEINGSNHDLSEMSEDEIGERVRKELWDRRYLIVMDDIWSIGAWDCVKSFFPDNNNGSRIMITTRLSNLAFELSTSQAIQMNFLDGDKSWNLLCKIVFGEELDCPVELEDIGKEIARSCRGLPLSIVVVGGLLTKSNRTRAHWEYILQNLNSIINLEDGEYCLQILRTRVLRPNKDKRLEEVADAYINELIDRNLILVDKLRWNGKVKVCKIHDLLRDLCLREAQKERFLYVLNYQRDLNIPQCMNMERRICTHDNTEEKYSPALESAMHTRSLISTSGWPELVQSHCFRLLRVYSGDNCVHCGLAFVEAIFQKVNLRFLSIVLRLPKLSRFPSSWLILWNLQTLKVDNRYCTPIMAPSEIWEMPLLRHVIINGLELPDPVCGENDLITLEDLHTISSVRNFRCSNVVIKIIPNIKTLKLQYTISCGEAESYNNFGLNNFGQLPKLQSLNLFFDSTAILDGEIFQCYLMQNLSLPHSLKKLTLGGTKLNWEEYMTKIGFNIVLLSFVNFMKKMKLTQMKIKKKMKLTQMKNSVITKLALSCLHLQFQNLVASAAAVGPGVAVSADDEAEQH